MKSRKFHKTLSWENNQKNNNKLNQLDQYRDWLIDKNFTKETIENYLATVSQYGESSMDTITINNCL